MPDDHTKMTLFDKMPSRVPYEGQNHTRLQHENEPSQGPSAIFWHAKVKLVKLLLEPEKFHRRSYDGLRCPHEGPDVVTIRAELEHFLYPSGVNFGTV